MAALTVEQLGCLEWIDDASLNKLLHSQIEVFAKALHKVDSMDAAQLTVTKTSEG